MPEDFELQLRPRSGLALKKGITPSPTHRPPSTATIAGEIGIILENRGACRIRSGKRETVWAQGIVCFMRDPMKESLKTLRGEHAAMDQQASEFMEAGLRTLILRAMTPKQRQNVALTPSGTSTLEISEMMEIAKQTSVNTCFNVRRYKLANLWDKEYGRNFATRLGIIEPMLSWNVFCVSFNGLPPSVNSGVSQRPEQGSNRGRYLSKEAKGVEEDGVRYTDCCGA